MDRVSDDGDRIDLSAQPSTPQPRKHTRMTSNPHEPDMWDPVHVFGDSHTPEDDDEGTPIGGIRPRDPVTGALLLPHEWRKSKRERGVEPEQTPRKHKRHF